MSTRKLSNITISQFECFLDLCGLKQIRTKGGHNVWSRSDLNRPVVVQSHVEPIPERIIKNNLRTIGYNRKEFFEILDQNLIVVKKNNSTYILEKKPKRR